MHRGTAVSSPDRDRVTARLLAALTTLLAVWSPIVRAAEPPETRSHVLLFSTSAEGEKRSIAHWGLDTAWPVADHVRRGMLYMGEDQVDVIRVSFPVNEPLVDGELPASKRAHFQTRLEIARIAGDKPFTMLPDTEAGVHPWFKEGREIIPQRWVQLIASAQRNYGKKMESVEPFNEADYGWGQGSVHNLNDILGAMRKSEEFVGVQLGGPSTLSADAAAAWYEPIKQRIDRATTHALGGSFASYANFFVNATANGHVADNPEVHNLVEVIAGAEYGLQSAIWWGTAELARGEFVKAVQGDRLAYAEDRPRWSAAALYRAPGGAVRGFLGSSERMGQTTTYVFACRDRPVFFNGDGPRHDQSFRIRRDTEYLFNVTWGEDVPQAIGGTYLIVNRHSRKVLGVSGADQQEGASVQQTEHERGAHQQWEVEPVFTRYGDQSYFVIRALHSGQVLGLADASHEEGATIVQSGDAHAAAHNWYFEYAGDNFFHLRNRWSTKYLQGDRDGGPDVQQASHSGEPLQQWRLIPIAARAIDFDAPETPAGLTASARPLAIALQWKANREADLAGYTVFRSASPGGPYDTIARGVTSISFVDNTARNQSTYYYVVKAVDHSLNQSARSAEVSASPSGGRTLVANYPFDGDATDGSENANHATPHGSPAYGAGRGGARALLLDGEDDYLRLPVGVADFDEITVSAWVYPQAGIQWQRIFDFGNGESHYLFLTPNSSNGTLRLAARNGGEEQQLNAPGLRESRWAHVAVTLSGGAARLYVNGKVAASSDSWTIKPSDFRPIFNYVGKSQFAVDPLFRGRISSFQVYNHALSADEIARLGAAQARR